MTTSNRDWSECRQYKEWIEKQGEHPAFHFWRSPADCTARLAQYLYTASCLLWSGINARVVSDELRELRPNWAGVSAYYSSVHLLRLFSFLLYGSFPTGHSDLAKLLGGEGGDNAHKARMNWLSRSRMCDEMSVEVTERKLPFIHVDALMSALQCLGVSDIESRLPSIGRSFEACRKLREDSNYESVVLAHQYAHGTGDGLTDFVNVQERMQAAVEEIRKVNALVFSFVGDVIEAVFSDQGVDSGIAVGVDEVPVKDQCTFIIWVVRQKLDEAGLFDIVGNNEVLKSWSFRDVESYPPSAEKLLPEVRFDRNHVKQGVMQEFNAKVNTLERAFISGWSR